MTDLMAREMSEQPDVLADALRHRPGVVSELRRVIPERLAGITLIARGSSDNAAVYGRYVLEMAARRPVALAAPSIHTAYAQDIDHRGWLAVAVSQSGETSDVIHTLEAMRRHGAVGVAVTNRPDSPLGRAADVILDLRAGSERAVPATKTFTAELAAFTLLAEALGPVPWTSRDWARLPDAMAWTLDDHLSVRVLAAALDGHDDLLCTGRGYLFPIALEAALKLKETARMHAEGYSSADLRHGPIALASPDVPVLAFLTPGAVWADVSRLVDELRNRAVEVFVIGDDRSALVPLPSGLPEPLVVFPAAVRLQQLAHELAVHRGLDPAHPAGLVKISG